MVKAISVKRGHSLFTIRLDTILYMEKDNRQITIHVTEGEDLCFYGRFDPLIPMLDERFVHPHESYVINMQHIYRLGRLEAVMFGGKTITMGRHCFCRLKRAYDEYIRNNIVNRPGT